MSEDLHHTIENDVQQRIERIRERTADRQNTESVRVRCPNDDCSYGPRFRTFRAEAAAQQKSGCPSCNGPLGATPVSRLDGVTNDPDEAFPELDSVNVMSHYEEAESD